MDCDANLVNELGDTTCWALKAIPIDISKLRNLEILELRVNSIQRVPIEIKALTKLKTLDLTDNPGLEEIENVVELHNLEELILYGCYLTKLPAAIGRLKKLRLLALTGNNIEAGELERLRKILPNCDIKF